MRLVWRNCCTYNQEGSEIYTLGKHLSDLFEERFSKVEELSKCELSSFIISSTRSAVGFYIKRGHCVENPIFLQSGHLLICCSS